ncbi:carboxylesterase family protein [Salinisphaera sp. SPP-AMP-43]|uniref:carboxylesterase family protein n=1 Tax=Salinisphaera sp. SPP-AMP-43 TaxID=3121288 RepID=UPI003C6E2BA7
MDRFLGMPYARSIAGWNRFAPPQPVETLVRGSQSVALSSIRATVLRSELLAGAPVLTPADNVTPGDDCRALNVWAPTDGSKDRPVRGWLHGGGWASGSGPARSTMGPIWPVVATWSSSRSITDSGPPD